MKQEISSIHLQQYIDDPKALDQEFLLKHLRLTGQQDIFLALEQFPKIIDAVFVALCTKGSCELLINQQHHHFKAGDMCVCFSATVLQALSKSADFEGIVLATNVEFIRNIDIPSISELFLLIRENPCLPLSSKEQVALQTYFRYINLAYERKKTAYRIEITRQLVLALCYEIVSIYQNDQYEVNHSYSHKDMLFRKFIRLLSAKYTTERRISFYAGALCITPKYLSTIVKEVSHKSAAEWINDFVLRNAKILLANTSLTIQQVADELHFSNPSFFTQYFRRATGKTPKAYRSTLKEQNGRSTTI